MVDTKDIYWLAGWLEGEGCFGFWGRKGHETPRISVNTTDKDVAIRAASLLGTKVTSYPLSEKTWFQFPHAKQSYQVNLHGPNSIGWMMTLFCLMGERRKDKIRQVVRQWQAISPRKSNVTKNRMTFPDMGRTG